jgi:hypothetical protein
MTDLVAQAMDLFEEVVGLSREQQRERLDAECAAVPELRAKVEELLGNHRDAETKAFLEPPPLPTGHEAPPNLPGYQTLMPPSGERDGWPKRGGMGVVWRVRDLHFQRPLALKVMKAAGSVESHPVRRFFAEARITAQLTHPSIVPVHAMGWLADGRPYYTMKLVEGKTLAELLKAGSDVASWRIDRLQVFARVCQALAFAHSKGVIHCDLKPANVMVGHHGEVQVMDWGLARVLAGSDVLPAEAAQTNGRPDESDDRPGGGGPGRTCRRSRPAGK